MLCRNRKKKREKLKPVNKQLKRRKNRVKERYGTPETNRKNRHLKTNAERH